MSSSSNGVLSGDLNVNVVVMFVPSLLSGLFVVFAGLYRWTTIGRARTAGTEMMYSYWLVGFARY